MRTLHAELTKAVEAIATSDDWRAFLDFARKLHSYSAQNRMWLFQQAMMRGWDDLATSPGFGTWLALGRYVRKGEHGLVRAGAGTREGDGRGRIRKLGRSRVQGRARLRRSPDRRRRRDPQPIRPQLLTGEGPAGAWAALSDLVAAQGFTVERASLYPANGQTSFATKVVTVADRLDEAAAIKTLAHELAHMMLHSPGQVDYYANRERCEVRQNLRPTWFAQSLGSPAIATVSPT